MPAIETTSRPVASAGSRNSTNVAPAIPLASKRSTVVLTANAKPAEDGTSDEVTPTQQAPGKPSAWTNGGGAALIKSSTGPVPARNAVARSTYNPSALRGPPTQAPLAAQMSQMTLGGSKLNPRAGYYDPSHGPTASDVTTNWKNAPSQSGNRSVRQAINTLVCKLSGYTRRDFKQGHIISLPFHTPNLNPDLDQTERRLTFTCEGPAYTKRRMMVILWLYQQDMLCLPFYTFEGKGIQGKPPFLQKEYVSTKNTKDKIFRNQGVHPPVAVDMYKWDMLPMTCVHLTGVMKVGCQEDIVRVGRMTPDSHKHLIRLWRTLSQAAQDEGW